MANHNSLKLQFQGNLYFGHMGSNHMHGAQTCMQGKPHVDIIIIITIIKINNSIFKDIKESTMPYKSEYYSKV